MTDKDRIKRLSLEMTRETNYMADKREQISSALKRWAKLKEERRALLGKMAEGIFAKRTTESLESFEIWNHELEGMSEQYYGEYEEVISEVVTKIKEGK